MSGATTLTWLYHAERAVQDTETLQATIQLMAPHTNKLTQSQQARLVAAVGAAGAAQQLSDLTLKGTASLLPSAAMLAGVDAWIPATACARRQRCLPRACTTL